MEIGKVDRKVGEEIGAVKSVLASIANVYNILPLSDEYCMVGHLPS